jgi:hypothetical protein
MQLSGFTGPIPRSSHSLLLGYRAFPQVNFEVLITIQADAAAGIGGHREASVGIRRIGLGLGITWPRKRKYEIPIRWPRPQVESGVARRANRSAVGSGSGRPRHRLDEGVFATGPVALPSSLRSHAILVRRQSGLAGLAQGSTRTRLFI